MKQAFMPVFAFMALCAAGGAQAASERVGQATLVKTAVTGQTGPIVVKSPVHRNERIRTSKSGLGEFLFRDGTKLAVGAGSSVVVDKFVFDDDKRSRRSPSRRRRARSAGSAATPNRPPTASKLHPARSAYVAPDLTSMSALMGRPPLFFCPAPRSSAVLAAVCSCGTAATA